MKKFALQEEFVQVPNATAKAVESENNISLQALGLIVNLWSYNVEKWELHKTELYKRYGKNKETSVKNAWNELKENRYIVEFKYRNGKKWEYVYVYRVSPFSDKEIAEIYQEGQEEYGEIWGLDFQDLKMETPKWRPQNQDIRNIESKTDSIKEKPIKEIDNPNLNLETKNNSNKTDENLLWNLEIPMQIKQKIKTKIKADDLQLSATQILDIENAYYHQIDKGLIIPDCSNEDDLLNDFGFAQTLIAILDKVNVTEIKSMKAIIDNWVEKGFSYKFDKNRSVFR